MKKLIAIVPFFLLSFYCANAQLISMSPNQAQLNQTLTTTITANNIFIQAGSPTGNLFKIQLTNGSDIIPIFDYANNFGFWSTNVIDPNTVVADMTVPSNATPGIYELQVVTGDVWSPWWNQFQYLLPGAFTVLAPDGYINGKLYRDVNKNGVQDPGELGISGQVKLLPDNITISTDAGGNYSFPVINGNYSVLYVRNTNNLLYVTTGPDTLSVTINSGNSNNNDFGVEGTLLSVTPDSAFAGITSNHVFVADKPIFTLGVNPYGNISQVLVYSSPSYYVSVAADVNIIDPYSVQVTMNIPPGTLAANNIDIKIFVSGTYVGSHFLRSKFKISPPDGYITGNVFYDVNQNGIKDAGEPGLSSYPVRVMPFNNVIYSNSSGIFNYGAPNGTYTLIPQKITSNNMFPVAFDSLSATINNNTVSGIDFAMKPALYSVTPETGYRGLTSAHTFVADKPIFVPGANPNGNISAVRVFSSPNIYPTVANSVTVIDSFTVHVVISIPIGTSIANNVDVYFYMNTGLYPGYHYLRQQFDIVNPLASVVGKAFFDQNQNKIFDSGEPGIAGVKLSLLPDSTFAFSNYAGNFEAASYGGVQTLTYTNNVPGLVLFTDSTSYTFNMNGQITGKDFGFISGNPDYSIDVHTNGIFPRCNTQQNFYLWIRNTGNFNYSARVWLNYSANLNLVSTSPIANTVSNDTIYWDIPNLPPYTNTIVRGLFDLPAGGQSITFSAKAASLDMGGVEQLSSISSAVFNVVCAYDPNDKNVKPAGVSIEHFTLMSDTLEYRIRFQNTGNDTAINVVVLDTLDQHFNFETFEIVGSSHSMNTQLQKNGAIKFIFDNIMLPDSGANEAESHGFILCRVNAKNGLPDSTEVFNTGHIYFDYNPGIITNTTLNTLVYSIPFIDPLPIELISFTGNAKAKYNELIWVTASEVNNDHFELERAGDELNFRKIVSISGNGTTNNMSDYSYHDYDISGNEGFYYRLKQVDYDGQFEYSEIIYVKRNNTNSDSFVTVFPNPFKSNIYLHFTELQKNTLVVDIFDLAGKNIYSVSIKPENKLFDLNIPENTLQKGMYLIRITSDSEQSLFKLIKD